MNTDNICSQRILLRVIQKQDTDSIFAYRSLDSVARYQYWEPFTKEKTIDFVNKCSNTDINTKGEWIGLAIIDREYDTLAGDCSLKINDTVAEIGCNISPQYQHKGIAKETLGLIIDYCFTKIGVDKVFGITDSQNTASIKLMESLNMDKVSDFEERLICKGRLSIEHKYMIDKNNSK